MNHFKHQFQVKSPIERVIEYHNHAHVLKQLTPPPIFLKFKDVEPTRDGASTDFTIWMGPFPVPWRATYSDVNPQSGFTDTQTEGPFEKWVHQHRFIKLDESTTSVVDEIEAIPGRSAYRGLMSRIMWLSLPLLFKFRAVRTRWALENR